MQDPGPPERQASDVDLVPRLGPPQPSQAPCPIGRQEAGLTPLQLSHQSVFVQMPRHRQRHRFESPTKIVGGHRFAPGRFPGPTHTISQAFSEDPAVGWRSVVVLPSPDVATGPVEVNVQHLRHGDLAQKASDSRKIRIGDACAIITLGMRGIVAQDRHRTFVIPKAYQRNHRVDDALGFRPQSRVGCGRVAHGPHLAVRTEDSPIGRHLAHLGLPGAHLVERLGLGGSAGHRSAESTQELSGEGSLVIPWADSRVAKNFLRTEITFRRIMLMQRMDRHPVYGRPRRRGQLLPKRIVSLIANTDPIDGTKNHRTILPQDHNASGPQAQIPDVGDRIVCQA